MSRSCTAAGPRGAGSGFDWRPLVAGVIALHRQGHLERAEASYRQLLKALPDHPDLNHFYGVLLHQRGRVDEALAHVRRSIELDPSVAAWHNNLGNLLLDRQQHAEAALAYRRCLELDPEHTEVRINLGCLLRLCGQWPQAEAVLRDAIARAPEAGEAHANLALLLAARGELDEALDAGTRALSLKPDNPRSCRLLGLLCARRGRLDMAAQVFGDWLARCPDDPQARHHLAAVTGQGVPQRASDAYVVDVFDRFATSFDAKLASLEYHAPQLCAQRVGQLLGEPQGLLRVLDAGCGTGLCGPGLRAHARELVGVDLSANMLERAVQRGVYDRAERSELVGWMNASGRSTFDLIVSADTLCYFGDLRPVFAAAAACAAPGAWLVFTLEALDDAAAPDDFRLMPHGRYAHRREPVARGLEAAGWRQIEAQAVVLRQEAGQPVSGWLFSAQAA